MDSKREVSGNSGQGAKDRELGVSPEGKALTNLMVGNLLRVFKAGKDFVTIDRFLTTTLGRYQITAQKGLSHYTSNYDPAIKEPVDVPIYLIRAKRLDETNQWNQPDLYFGFSRLTTTEGLPYLKMETYIFTRLIKDLEHGLYAGHTYRAILEAVRPEVVSSSWAQDDSNTNFEKFTEALRAKYGIDDFYKLTKEQLMACFPAAPAGQFLQGEGYIPATFSLSSNSIGFISRRADVPQELVDKESYKITMY